MIRGGLEETDACVVGRIVDGIVVAFRGTLPFDIHQIPTLVDWLGDFQADPVSLEGFPGALHAGFARAFSTLWPLVTAELARQQAAAPAGLPVFVTGHSKGGAIAAL